MGDRKKTNKKGSEHLSETKPTATGLRIDWIMVFGGEKHAYYPGASVPEDFTSYPFNLSQSEKKRHLYPLPTLYLSLRTAPWIIPESEILDTCSWKSIAEMRKFMERLKKDGTKVFCSHLL